MSAGSITCSIVVPLCNEEAVLPELCRRLRSVMASADVAYEILLVNDGSTDRTLQRLLEVQDKNSAIRAVDLS